MIIAFFMGAALLAAQTAVMGEIQGTVEVRAPGAPGWKAAEPGMVLARAALISTGFKSTARIRVGSSNIMVQPLTRLSLEEIIASQDREETVLNIRAGRIRANVNPPRGGTASFTVKSPTATASVRGTVFEFDGVNLRVAEGLVYLSGAGVTGMYVGPGHTSAVDRGRGKVPGTVETLKEDLSPALPVGAAPEEHRAVHAAAAELSIEFNWE
jgi:hypothetical protein